jgi:selenocysteine-specific elongation factor
MTEPTAPNLIIGTAGHVDHGKTALIQRLTGINTDRLQEEQERGLTIDLGFAWLQLPSGAWAGIVDVPGHERFVKNMLAGATGIDLFLLVVAADEGVMPQTREHLTILDVLQIGAGMVVLTKSDLVEPGMMDLVREDVAQALAGTVFAGAPMVAVSSRTGEGFDELVARLDEVARHVKPRDVTGPTRMQVDRSFTMKGFGTVLTGSLIRGRLAVDQELELVPSGLRTRVRSLEVYGQHLSSIAAPCRVGVNVAGLGREEVQRGDQLIAPGSMSPAWMLDVRLRLSPDARRPLEYRERVHIHHGAAEVLGRVVLLEADVLTPGQESLAQLRLEAPLAAAAGDRFVIRRYSPPYAIGGGVVLDPRPSRHRRRETATLERLRSLEAGGLADRALDWARTRDRQVFGAGDLATALQVDHAEAETLTEELSEAGTLLSVAPGRYLDTERAEALQQAVLDALGIFHSEQPLRPAMPANRLQAALDTPPTEALQWALTTLRVHGQVTPEQSGWRLSGHRVALSPQQEEALAKLQAQVQAAGLSAPTRDEVLHHLENLGDARALLSAALDRGPLLVVGEFIMARSAVLDAAQKLAAAFTDRGPLAVGDVRDVWASSRKYVVPLLEYFDGTGFTRRDGDKRTVLRAPGPSEGA